MGGATGSSRGSTTRGLYDRYKSTLLLVLAGWKGSRKRTESAVIVTVASDADAVSRKGTEQEANSFDIEFGFG